MGGRGASGARAPREEYTGAVRYSVSDYGGGAGAVTAHQDVRVGLGRSGSYTTSREIGSLEWGPGGKIAHVEVGADRRRMGVGREMYRRAQQATGGKIVHSEDRTGLGEAFARGVGGTVPARSEGSAARSGRDLGSRSRYAR